MFCLLRLRSAFHVLLSSSLQDLYVTKTKTVWPSGKPASETAIPLGHITAEPEPELYQWPVLSGPRQFRLLGLRFPAEDGATGSSWVLEEFSLNSRSLYYSLSYTWCAQAPTEPLLCEDRVLKVS